nr:MAG TPA: cutinase [Caudoviricetes sp.]
MKKFICVLVCLLMIMSCAYGCARPSIETAPETIVSEPETSAPTEIEVTVSREDELVELEETFINSFGEDNVSFWWSDEGDAYFITIWCDFTFDEFYEFDVNSETRDNLDFLCLMGNSVTNVDTFLTLYSKTEGVIYASYNGADFTREALISQGANN